MDERSWIVHLIGFAGVGKLTVATELARQESADDPDRRMVVVDNHLTGNPILALLQLDGRGRAPEAVWPYVEEVRAVVHRAIPALTPATWSFVFTNVILVDDVLGHRTIEALRRLAAERGSVYVPVVLHCEREENLRRAESPGRAENHKWVDVEAISEALSTTELFVPHDSHLLEVETTHIQPVDTVAAIHAHLRAPQAPTASS